jgi:hypothetical membrane protein
MARDIDKYLILSGLVSSTIFFIISVPLGFFKPGHNHLTDVISKMGAVDSPIMIQTNILFFLFGFLMLLFGLGMFRKYPKYFTGKIASFLVILSGLSVALIGFFPCDPGCINVSIVGDMHQFFSETPLILGLFALIFYAIEEFRGGGFRDKYNNRYWAYFMVLYIILAASLGYVHLELDPITLNDGLFEVLAISIPASIIAIISVYFYKKEYLKPDKNK